MQFLKSYPSIWLLLAVFIEVGFQTWWNKQWGDYLSPTVMFLAGVMTCWVAYRMVAFKTEPIPLAKTAESVKRKSIVILTLFLLGTIWIGMEYATIQAKFPVKEDGTGSDVIPSLLLYVKRFLAGAYPYQPLEFDGWTVMPTYFPMMWMPYSFSEILNIDYRWTAYLVFLIPLFFLQWPMRKQDISILEIGFKVLLPFGFIYLYMYHFDHIMGYGVELMPVGLYFLLVLSLRAKHPILIAIPIVFVLLSRYAFTFWLPVYILTIWMERGFKEVFKVSVCVFVGVLLLYVIPFLSKDWDIFFEGLAYYGKTAETAWQWERGDGRPLILITGLSHAIYFYDFVEGELLERLRVNRIFHITMCLLTALGIFYIYWKKRNRGLNVALYLLIALKLYLVVFYSFFYVPFRYLFQLPMFLTIPILYHIALFRKQMD
ncbi:MAG: hypothetical protein AAF573_12705 [Bacteroidota bacterium]